MYGRFPWKVVESTSFQAQESARSLADVDRVYDQDAIESEDMRNQAQPLRSPVDQGYVRWNPGVALKELNGVDPQAVIGMNQVAET